MAENADFVDDGAGCQGCREVGPLLVAPGASGRTWVCQRCGHRWSPNVEADNG